MPTRDWKIVANAGHQNYISRGNNLNSGPSYHRDFRNKSYLSLRKFRQNKLLREKEQICSVTLYVPNCTVQNLSRQANSSSARRKNSHFMQPGGSLPYLQQLIPCPYAIQSRNSHSISAKSILTYPPICA